jgi:Arc/MetJ-type ribon-helix-helix transcriptional regulator
MPVQLVTRVSDDIAEAVERLVTAGVFASRSEAVRVGLETIVEGERRRTVGQAIVEGYRASLKTRTISDGPIRR